MTTSSTETVLANATGLTAVETAPAPTAPDPDLRRLVENYHELIRERGVRYPVPYQFSRELGKGRQGIVYLALRHGARGCLTRHAVKLHDPGIYSSAEKYWIDMGRLARRQGRPFGRLRHRAGWL